MPSLPTDVKEKGMSEAQKLCPGAIYAVHRILHERWPGLKPVHGRKTIVLIPSLFSKYSRTFHWLAIENDSWWFGQRHDFTFNGVLEKLKDLDKPKKGCGITAWQRFCENLPTEIPLFDKAAKYVDHLIKDEIPELSDKEKCIFHKYLLTLYEGYRHDPRLFLDGIIYRNLEKFHENKNDEDENSQSLGISYLLGSYIGEAGKKCETHHAYPWVECVFYDMNGEKIGKPEKFQSQETCDEKDEASDLDKPKELDRHGWEVADFILNTLFFESVVKRIGKCNNEDDSELKHFLILPIYDAWVRDEMFGALCGNLTLMFSDERERKQYCRKEMLSKLREVTYLILRDLRHSFLSLIASAPIQPPYDLIEHFVRNLRFLQDWKRIVVYRKEGDVNIPQYCFKWSMNGGGNLEWKRFDYKNRSKTENGCKACKCKDKENCLNWTSVKKTHRYLNIDAGELLDDFNIPNISLEEKEMYGLYMFAFEYPLTSVIPENEEKREELNALYKRQQIAVMQALIPKVRARRYALRTAATTIMSRNMSHNIGSHVLSAVVGGKYPSLVGAIHKKNDNDRGTEEQELWEYVTHRNNLLQYLQERMDFLAEAATAHSYLEFPVSFSRAINEFTKQDLLKEHISGIRKMAGIKNIAKENGKDNMFGVPGGRLGIQAIFVILENIIRNTAKHAPNKSGKVSIRVTIKDTKSDYPDLMRVRVWDMTGSGCSKVDGIPLCDRINNLIEQDMIDQDGRLESSAWGLREMRIAAAYLRKIRLEDLEDYLRHKSGGCDHAHRDDSPLLEALAVNNYGEDVIHNEEGNLCYQFFVRRARIALLVGLGTDAEVERKLRRHGIDVVSSLDECPSTIEHQYVVWLPDSAGTLPVAEERVSWPIRLLTNENISGSKCVMDNDAIASLNDALKVDGDDCGYDVWAILAKAWRECLEAKYKQEQGVKLYCIKSDSNSSGDTEGGCGEVAAKLNDDDLQNAIIYDRHAKALNSSNKLWHQGNDIKKLFFWERFDKPYDQANLFEHPGDMKDALVEEFLAAALSVIVVIDERVQEAIDQHAEIKGILKMDDAVRLRRIYVPPKQNGHGACDLKGSPQLQAVIDFMEGVKNECSGIDFVVVHQGILERLQKIEDQDVESIRIAAERHGAEFVVCSGRGIPTGLGKNTRFVPLSSVLRWVAQVPSKYHLYQLLCSSRRP